MVDRRTRRQKLEAMAADRSSPNEAAIAQRILDEARPPEVPADMYVYSDDMVKWSRAGKKTRYDPSWWEDWGRTPWDVFKPSGPDRR